MSYDMWLRARASNCADETEDAPAGHLEGILQARGARYGKFTDNAKIAQLLKATLRIGKRWGDAAYDVREAADNICIKLSRMLTGDPEYVDNWDDIAGYAKVVADRIRGDVK